MDIFLDLSFSVLITTYNCTVDMKIILGVVSMR